MSATATSPCTAFKNGERLASGPLSDVALAVKSAQNAEPTASLLTFDDRTGRVIDLDLRGSDEEIVARLDHVTSDDAAAAPRGRGRPKLGVVAREVTLLPRHWDWLGAQPGGASATLRRLVEDAKRTDGGRQDKRQAQERAYCFMSAMAGDLPGFEEAARALFADDRARFGEIIAEWPADISSYACRLAFTPPSEA